MMAMVTAFMGQAMPSGGAGFTSIAIIFEPVNLPVADFVYVLSLNWLRARLVVSGRRVRGRWSVIGGRWSVVSGYRGSFFAHGP